MSDSMIALTVATCRKIISEQSTVLDRYINGTPFYRNLDFIGGYTATFGMYGNTLASDRTISAYLLVHCNRFGNHSFHSCNFLLAVENIYMRFSLAGSIRSHLYGKVVI